VLIDEAIHNFRAAGPELLDEATPYLWEYYRSVASQFDEDEWDEHGIPELDADADIWAEVHLIEPPCIVLGGDPLAPAPTYISFEGEVSWEPDHGLELVVEHGRSICKVGPYDGHSTNAMAYDDATLLGVIFR
jgi:hypothetical protein